MATLFARHDVTDFDSWKEHYDAFDAERQAMGVTGDGVYRTDGDPNNVTIYHHFENVEAAKAFATSDRLREVMQAAGVEGEPDVWITVRV